MKKIRQQQYQQKNTAFDSKTEFLSLFDFYSQLARSFAVVLLTDYGFKF